MQLTPGSPRGSHSRRNRGRSNGKAGPPSGSVFAFGPGKCGGFTAKAWHRSGVVAISTAFDPKFHGKFVENCRNPFTKQSRFLITLSG